MFSLLYSGVNAKRGFEFHNQHAMVSRIWQKVNNGVSLSKEFPLPTLLSAGYSMKLS